MMCLLVPEGGCCGSQYRAGWLYRSSFLSRLDAAEDCCLARRFCSWLELTVLKRVEPSLVAVQTCTVVMACGDGALGRCKTRGRSKQGASYHRGRGSASLRCSALQYL